MKAFCESCNQEQEVEFRVLLEAVINPETYEIRTLDNVVSGETSNLVSCSVCADILEDTEFQPLADQLFVYGSTVGGDRRLLVERQVAA